MRLIIYVLLAFTGSVSGLRAQGSPSPGPRVAAHSFASARYAAGGSMTLVSGLAIGRLMAIVGSAMKPKSDYTAISVGPGISVRLSPGFRIVSIAALTASSDGISIDVYAIPSLRVGSAQVDARMYWQEPVSGDVRRQFKINPVTVTFPVVPRFRIGLGAVMSAKAGSSARLGFGPLVAVRAFGGVLTQEFFVTGSRFEARFGYTVRP